MSNNIARIHKSHKNVRNNGISDLIKKVSLIDHAHREIWESQQNVTARFKILQYT